MERLTLLLTKGDAKKIDDVFSKNILQLEKYAELLLWWNGKINLVSRDVSRETILMHVKHSLFISLTDSFKISKDIIDTGAGGGLPGIPLSICFPEKNFVINDIVTKKIFAVNDMINKLELNSSVKGVAGDVGQIDFGNSKTLISKHAFKIDQLYNIIKGKNWERIVFLKGHEEASDEGEKLGAKINMQITKLDSEFMDSFYNGKGLVEIERKSL